MQQVNHVPINFSQLMTLVSNFFYLFVYFVLMFHKMGLWTSHFAYLSWSLTQRWMKWFALVNRLGWDGNYSEYTDHYLTFRYGISKQFPPDVLFQLFWLLSAIHYLELSFMSLDNSRHWAIMLHCGVKAGFIQVMENLESHGI